MNKNLLKYFTLSLTVFFLVAGVTQNQLQIKSFAKKAPPKTTQAKKGPKKELTLDEILKNGKPTVIHFSSQYCYDCQTIKPFIDKLKSQHKKKINFIIIDIKDNKPITQAVLDKFQVFGVPYTVYLDKKGKQTKILGGARSEESYKKSTEELLKK